jgi:hypothetical protein
MGEERHVLTRWFRLNQAPTNKSLMWTAIRLYRIRLKDNSLEYGRILSEFCISTGKMRVALIQLIPVSDIRHKENT